MNSHECRLATVRALGSQLRLVVLTLIATGVVLPLSALDPSRAVDQYTRRHWSAADGLPQSSVNAITQTRDGYLWLGTFGGLARFDGLRFTPAPVSPRLAAARVLALLEDRGGTLWIGTEDSGLCRLDRGAVTCITASDGLPSDTVLALAEDGSGAIWVGTGGGLVRWTSEGIAVYTVADGLPDDEVWAVLGGTGEVWAGTKRGVARFVDGRVVPLDLPAVGSSWVWSFARDTAGRVLAGTSAGLLRLDRGRAELLSPTPGVRVVREDVDGNIWFGGDRLCRLAGGIPTCLEENGDLGTSAVRALVEDREGSLWVGTDGGGLSCLRDGAVTTYTSRHGLPDPRVLPVVGDGTGGAWVGTVGGVVHFRQGRFEPLLRPGGSQFLFVSALHVDASRTLWIGDDGLTRYQGGTFTHYTTADGLPDRRVQAIASDAAGRLWVGTAAGLACLDGGKLKVFRKRDGLVHDDVRHLSVGRDGTLWIGTTAGLGSLRDGTFTRYTTADGLAHPSVRDVLADDSGTVWVGTYGGGLARLKDGGLTTISTDQGLDDDVVSRILADDAGHFWLSGNRGIFRVDRAELEAVADGRRTSVEPLALGVADGMRTAECNGRGQPAGWRTEDGTLLFATIDGLAVVEPRRLATNLQPPPAVVEEVLADGNALDLGRPLTVPAGCRNLELRYTALSLARPEQNSFRYQLNGFDEAWVEAGNRRVAYYTRVPPGRYRFQVTAANAAGVWNQTGAACELTLLPTLQQTWWFHALAGLGALALVGGLFSMHAHQLRTRHRRLTVAVEERTRELAELNQRLTSMVDEQTHELRRTRDLAMLTLAKMAELRDDETGKHMERIAAYSRRLAQALPASSFPEVTAEFIDELYRSSPLHDIGKVAIPDVILRKRGPLNEAEVATMRDHCEVGGDALRLVVGDHGAPTVLHRAMEIAYFHHERWDGSGYPRGLARERIPFAARIVAVADVYDAIRSRRPYKREESHVQAVAHICEQRGRHFDPRLVDAFVTVADDFDRIYQELRPEV